MKYLRQILFAISISLIMALFWSNSSPTAAQGPGDQPDTSSLRESLVERLEANDSSRQAMLKPFGVSNIPCENGFAKTGLLPPHDKFPCANVDLLSWLSLAEIGADANPTFTPVGNGNGNWGWTDPNTNREYVIAGHSAGATFIDITDPINPIIVGILPPNAPLNFFHVWGEYRVYSNTLYKVNESDEEGMQFFDLTQLDGATPGTIFQATGVYTGFNSAHTISANDNSGFVYVMGTGLGTVDNFCPRLDPPDGTEFLLGGLHMVDVSNPLAPTFAGCYNDLGYFHDNECVTYNGPDADYTGREICFASKADQFGGTPNYVAIIDVTDKLSPTLISTVTHPLSVFAHQTWPTEDLRFLLMNDEIDEWTLAPDIGYPEPLTGNRTYIFNIEDLDNPVVLEPYVSGNTAQDHNIFIKGDYAYQANYASGLRITDLRDIENGNLKEGAFFDSRPEDDRPLNFEGVWNVFPFFDSGVIAINDIERGVFIVRPKPGFRLVATPPGGPSVRPPAFTHEMCVGDEAVYEIEVVSFLGFNTDVDLTSAGAPANSTATFGANPVTPSIPTAPSTTTLTISTTGTTPIGSYNVEVTGSTTATDSQTIILPINVIQAPSQPNLLAPANTALVPVSMTPEFSWTPAITVGNVTYLLEVATDQNFTNIVYTATVENASNHQITTPLAPDTQYFWRVRNPQNICGTGASSEVFTFKTVSQIALTKTVGTDPDPNACAATTDITIPSGSAVYYCVTVTNTTSLTFTSHTLSDPNLNLQVTFPFTLAPGGVISVTNQVLNSLLGLPAALGPITPTTDLTNTLTFAASDGLVTSTNTATATVRVGPGPQYLPIISKN